MYMCMYVDPFHPAQASANTATKTVVIGTVVGIVGGLAVVLQLIVVFVLCVLYPKHKKGMLVCVCYNLYYRNN